MSAVESLARAVCAAETISPATSWEGCSDGMRERYRTFASALAEQGVGMLQGGAR